MSKFKILITGGAGYIGSHIAHDLIELGHDVIVFDNMSLGLYENIHSDSKLIKGDVRNKSDLENAFRSGIDVVFHFAALKAAGESMINPMKYADNNIRGTINLLNGMAEAEVKYFVFSSSAAVYGEPQFLPINESHPKNPINYYGYTKLCIEQNLEWYSRLNGMKYAVLRYFNATGYDINGRIKGKEQNPANLSPIIMETIAGIRNEMSVYGNDYDTPDGTCIRDYIHVNDLSSAHIMSMNYLINNHENLVVNLGTGIGHSVMDMINSAENATKKKVNYKITERREGDPEELVAGVNLAMEKLGWEAMHSDLETIFKSMMNVYL